MGYLHIDCPVYIMSMHGRAIHSFKKAELIAKEIAESLAKLTSTGFEWLSGEVVRGKWRSKAASWGNGF